MSQEGPEGTPGGQSGGREPGGGQFGPWPGQQPPDPGHQNGSPYAHQNGSAPGHQNGSAPGPAGYSPRSHSDERAWVTVSYLTPLVFGPLIIYLIKKNEFPLVRYHAAQALNMTITAAIYTVILLGLATAAGAAGHTAGFVLGFGLWIVMGCVYLVYLIVAAVGPSRGGRPYRVPGWLCFRLVR
jgi:uncharacterized protein